MDVNEDREIPAGPLVPYAEHPNELAPAEHYPYPYPEPAPVGRDWRRLLAVLRKRGWWILAATALGTVGGVVASRFFKPNYQVGASIWLERPDVRSGPIRPGQVLGGEGWGNLLRSYAVLEPVVRELRLYLRPIDPATPDSALFANFGLAERFFPGTYELTSDSVGNLLLSREGTGNVWRGRRGDTIGESVGLRWAPPASALASLDRVRFELRSPRRTALALRRRLQVRFEPNASLIITKLNGTDPERAATILNTLHSRFIKVATDLKNQKLRETVAILEEQTNFTAERLRAAELALENNRVETITLPTESQAMPVPGIGVAQDPVFGAFFNRKLELAQLQTELDQLDRILSDARAGKPLDVLSLQMIPSVAKSPQLAATLADLNDKEAKYRAMLFTYTEKYQGTRDAAAELSTIKQRTLPTLVAQLAAKLREEQATLQESISAQTAELRQIPTRTIEQARLRRELDAAAAIQGTLRTRLKQAQLAEATALPDMHVVDDAAPTEPYENPTPRIVLIAAFMGLSLGIGLVLLLDRLDGRIRYPEEIGRSLGLPMLGVVPRLDSRKTVDGIAEVTVESFRAIRTQINHFDRAAGGPLLVTSPAPRDGKSMVSANLAISYAGTGLRTLLVDADTKRGHAEGMFGCKRGPGLTDCLTGRAAVNDAIQPTTVDGLFLLARGHGAGFTSDLLDGPEMRRLLETLRERFDVVLLDAPPLAAGADALVLGELCEKVILVVRAGETDTALARAKLQMIGNVDLTIVGAILNAVPSTAEYYPYYATYYYSDAQVTA